MARIGWSLSAQGGVLVLLEGLALLRLSEPASMILELGHPAVDPPGRVRRVCEGISA